jgi:putative ABC transport system permease protein
VTALTKKLIRDLLGVRGQVLTIALVVACGITSYITMRTAYDSLLHSRDRYYEEYRFADAFASVERAPKTVNAHLEEIPGVISVDSRVVERVLVPMSGMARPASGTIVSLDHRERGFRLNEVHIKKGREIDPTRPDEVLVLDAFAEAHRIGPGDEIKAVINGTLRELRIVGTALSPEYILALAPGDLSYDPAQVPVIWMDEKSLSAAFRMEGGFNNVALRLEAQANVERVLSDIDRVLQPYGSGGAISRKKQTSNYILEGELSQLDMMAGFVPYLFLFVAALLVNVVLSRLVQLQRSQIATLKSLGYSDGSIGFHYLELVSVIVLLGAVLGVSLGAYLGSAMMDLYTGEWFRFPDPRYELTWSAAGFSVGISVASAICGAWLSVRHVVALPPAEAMRAPAPASYKRSILETLGLWRFLDPVVRMIWREVSRKPVRVLLSAIGISLATGLVVVARSMWDAMDHLMDIQFQRAMKEDLTVSFSRPVSGAAISELSNLPGVVRAEGLRMVPVRLESGHRFRDTAIIGYPRGMRLRQLLDADGHRHELPEDGIVLTGILGDVLGVKSGDRVAVKLREGDWQTRELVVSGFIDEAFGMQGHMQGAALNRLMRDDGRVSTALLRVDRPEMLNIQRRLQKLPLVAKVASPHDFKKQFDEQSAAMVNTFTLIMTLFSAVIAVGVIYNNARVSLSQRAKDLASLRVLGFTHREISGIIFGEQAIQVVIALPLGLWIGRFLSAAMMSAVDPEAYRFPIVVSERTYLFAMFVTISSAFLSALILRRKMRRLDLIAVLKTRE